MPETTIPCPHCGKSTIRVNDTPKSFSYKRGFTGKKGLYLYRGHTTFITKTCPKCKKDPRKKPEIDHEAVIKKIKEQGLPTVIEC